MTTANSHNHSGRQASLITRPHPFNDETVEGQLACRYYLV